MSRSKPVVVLLVGLGLLAVGSQWLVGHADAPRPKDRPQAVASGKAGSDPLGYTAVFEEEVRKIGQITPDEFARRFPGKANYLGKLSWDPTTGKFFDQVMMDPNADASEVRIRGQHAKIMLEAEKARARAEGKPEPKEAKRKAKGLYDFRLNKDELAVFKANGFVVSERMGAASCTDMLYRIYERDLPVFITSDAVLHAWHRTYDAMLEEIEVAFLSPTLAQILAGMAEQVPAAKKQYGDGVLAQSLADADYFLAVAQSLHSGTAIKSRLGQDARVQKTLDACDRLQLQKFDLFGRPERKVDFSQFKPRGHYEKSELLRRYFRAMMWCGRIDMRVAGTPDLASPREMGGAVVLHHLLKRSGKSEQWQQFDRMIQTFVGKTDSMTFAQLGGVLANAGIKSPADIKGLNDLSALQAKVLAGNVGQQHIRSHHFWSDPDHPIKVELPRSFTFLGQKFVVDSWVTAKVVYDDILWNDRKVIRRVPSCLDVAFAAFGNDAVVPELVARMKNDKGREFRDGLNYQHNLAATRQVIDRHTDAAWKENLYTSWLSCLRELSTPTTDAKHPEAMRTRAWAMKSLNTQLASWAQLRHDTVLYAKQSYTAEDSCFYPAGYAEPVPRFWAKLEQMAESGAALIEKSPYPNNYGIMQKQHAAHLRKFTKAAAMLRVIAEKELAQEELTKDEVKFLEETVQVSFGCGGPRRYHGWYPQLFYNDRNGGDKWDALVADVHTDVPSPVVGDPGCVLHQGVGNVDLLVIAIDNGKDRMVYLGPTLSHYEFEMPGVTRKSDSEWRKDINTGKLPPRPEWTRTYLVPGENKAAKGYKGD